MTMWGALMGSGNTIPYTQTPSFRPTVEESAMASGLYLFVYEMRITAVVRFLDKLRNDNVGGL